MSVIDDALALATAELARGRAAPAQAALERASQVASELLSAAPIDMRHRLDAVTAIRRRLP